MAINDELGKRMKEYYEQIPKTKLMRRVPVAIRLDGKAFHSFTRGFKRPFDEVLMRTMKETMKYLCENIQGCVLGYTQSDEITLILVDYKKLNSSAWFDYEVQKMCSVAASMATMAFNKFFEKNVKNFEINHTRVLGYMEDETREKTITLIDIYWQAVQKGAMFDARCFNIPKEEVANLIYWRQLDATRNSIQMVGQANFSHSELQGKTCSAIQNMLLSQKDINWNNFSVDCKRGATCIYIPGNNWVIDTNMPIIKGEDRKYIEDLIYIGE